MWSLIVLSQLPDLFFGRAQKQQREFKVAKGALEKVTKDGQPFGFLKFIHNCSFEDFQKLFDSKESFDCGTLKRSNTGDVDTRDVVTIEMEEDGVHFMNSDLEIASQETANSLGFHDTEKSSLLIKRLVRSKSKSPCPRDGPNSKQKLQVVQEVLHHHPDLKGNDLKLLLAFDDFLNLKTKSWNKMFTHDRESFYMRTQTAAQKKLPVSEYAKLLQSQRNPDSVQVRVPIALKAATQQEKGVEPLNAHQKDLMVQYGPQVNVF